MPILVGVSSQWRVKLEGVGFTKERAPQVVLRMGLNPIKLTPLDFTKCKN